MPTNPSNPVVSVSTAATSIPLLQSETVVFKERPAIILTILYIALIWLLGGLFLWLIIRERFILESLRVSPVVFFIIGFVFIILVSILALWLWFNTLYTLTSQRVEWRSGILAQKVISISLKNIENTSVTLPVLGRIFNYGNVIIEPAGLTTSITFGSIMDPETKQVQIEDHLLN